MKTVFLLNPKAGKGRGLDKIKEAVARASQELNTGSGRLSYKVSRRRREICKAGLSGG